MSTAAGPPSVNGQAETRALAGVVMMREEDYRGLLVRNAGLAERVAHLEYVLEYYRDVHHLYYESVKDQLEPEDPNWTPPPPEEAEQSMRELQELLLEMGIACERTDEASAAHLHRPAHRLDSDD